MPSKYRNVKTVVDGITFDSKLEAKRYGELNLLERAGEIKELQLQQKFPLMSVTRQKTVALIGHYIADFTYQENGDFIVEDTKGLPTPLYKWKKKHFEAGYQLLQTLQELTLWHSHQWPCFLITKGRGLEANW